jgi:nitrile hydratase accessory protein
MKHEPTIDSFAPEFNTASFEDPWQATLFALTVQTSNGGAFSWKEWVVEFSRAQALYGDRLSQETYYETWMKTFCTLLSQRSGIVEDDILALVEDWRRSYLVTPHGEPVVLQRGLSVPYHDHDCHAHFHAIEELREMPKPVYVDLAERN